MAEQLGVAHVVNVRGETLVDVAGVRAGQELLDLGVAVRRASEHADW
ncbi:MAG TPA: hypothetical protein VIJ07_07025 [Dermatophilaceae bacterium]